MKVRFPYGLPGAKNKLIYAWRILTNKKYREAAYYGDFDSKYDWIVKLNNVRKTRLVYKTKYITEGKGLFGLDKLRFGVGYGCVNHTSRSLLVSGVWFIPFNPTPQILNLQLLIRQTGIYASPYLQNAK